MREAALVSTALIPGRPAAHCPINPFYSLDLRWLMAVALEAELEVWLTAKVS